MQNGTVTVVDVNAFDSKKICNACAKIGLWAKVDAHYQNYGYIKIMGYGDDLAMSLSMKHKCSWSVAVFGDCYMEDAKRIAQFCAEQFGISFSITKLSDQTQKVGACEY